MRRATLVLSFLLAAPSCRHSPEEPLVVRDAGAEATVVASVPPSAALPDSGRQPGAGPEVRAFCEGAFGADAERLREKCSAADLGLSQAVARAAANLCSGDVASALSRGRAALNADAARACVALLRSQAMAQSREDDTFFEHPPCDGVLIGTQPEGGPCRASVECADGLACVGYRPGTDGVCKKPPRPGEPCSAQTFATILNAPAAALHHPPCARGAWCDGAACQTRVPAGKSCKANEACADGLACLRGKCATRAAAGRACATSADCLFGLWCEQAPTRGGSGKCAEKRAEGQECGASDACKGRCDIPKLSDGGAAKGVCASVCGSG